MKVDTVRGRRLASTLLAGAALLAAPPAFAQTSSAAADDEVEEVVVTGSRIRRVETTTSAPVAIVDAEEFTDRGFVQPGQLLDTITSNIPSFPIAPGHG